MKLQSNFYKILFYLLLNTCIFKSWTQNRDEALIQKEYFSTANECLAENKLENAIYYFYFAHHNLPKTKISEVALKKVDSLALIVRNEFVKKIQGIWKWKETGTNWGVQETPLSKNLNKTLIIEGLKIRIYEKIELDSTLIKSGNIKFLDTNIHIPPLVKDFTYLDSLIWTFNFKSKNRILIMRNTGHVLKKSRTLMLCGNKELKFKKI